MKSTLLFVSLLLLTSLAFATDVKQAQPLADNMKTTLDFGGLHQMSACPIREQKTDPMELTLLAQNSGPGGGSEPEPICPIGSCLLCLNSGEGGFYCYCTSLWLGGGQCL